MQNFKVLRNLADNGDNASLPRDIDHFIDFDSEKDMENFGQKIEQIGYKILSKQSPREDLKKFSINIMRNQNLENIDEDTWELINLAKDFNGMYDGWGCPIAK
ncbi:ribonuclease E inhibitor RraB [Campylobacter curvus]|uniref:ribonuclease E inhibitor RraB n=1 Tax=Campylobacter curvus TaxID=200 RepID=UPI00036312CA|nr:ribonuclease E inhibitor RraB [Campylobacter curvus]UEB50002.1 ribonuclease E inhibitor RraB [Campylobacter curvus]